MALDVKYFHSAMRGAPTVRGTAGTMIGLLDACLIDGFGIVTLTSLVVSGGVATATVSAGNSFEAGAVILLAGTTPGTLNGEARVLSATSTGFTFATTAADGAASGTVTAKYAPVGGWEKTFSDTNKAVYRSIDPQANGHYLRVDDSNAYRSLVFGYESMSDVNTGTGRFPTNALLTSGESYWFKYQSASAVATDWYLFGDSRFFFHAIAHYSNPAMGLIYPMHAFGFGDPIELAPGGDPWSTVLNTMGNAMNYAPHAAFQNIGSKGEPNYQAVTPRALSGLGSATRVGKRPYIGAGNSGADITFGAGVSPVDGKLMLSKMVLLNGDASTNAPRAELPGIYYLPNGYIFRTGLATGDVVAVDGGLAGRRMIAIGAGSQSGSNQIDGGYLVDATGPWR